MSALPSRPPARPDAPAELARLIAARPALNGIFEQTRRTLADRHQAHILGDWAAAGLDLLHANGGPAVLLAFWRYSIAAGDLADVRRIGGRVAGLCRHAGAKAAAAALDAFSRVQAKMPGAQARETWWQAMASLAEHAPDAVGPVGAKIDRICPQGNAAAFADFVATGLRHAGRRKDRLAAYFSLDDPLARRMIEASDGPGFATLEAELRPFLAALWRDPPQMRSLPLRENTAPEPRSNLAGPLLRLPENYPGVKNGDARRLYYAAAAHAGAHFRFSIERFRTGKLKPIEIVLTGMIEDARVEALAMRAYPGLRRLWAPYHTAEPGPPTAASLLARLARALFDPDYEDGDAIVEKARDLFRASEDRLEDPGISREIGRRLGNDFGQRRIQFAAKGHVVEPVYRDDGLGLWDFETEDPQQAEEIELAVEAARVERREEEDAPPGEDAPRPEAGRAKPAQAEPAGHFIASYPEWDAPANVERRDWTRVHEVPVPPQNPAALLAALDGHAGLRARIAALVRGAKIGRAQRLKRQAEGHDLDLDAVLDAAISLRAGEEPDGRVFRSSALRQRDLAVLLLIDTSESTRDRLGDGTRVLDVEKLAVALVGEAMQAMGDRFAIFGFASNGREEVNIGTVKIFDEAFDHMALARLTGLRSGLSTRLGAALRHAGAQIAPVRSFRKLLLVISDGEPSDVDVPDAYLVADARRAVLELKSAGIDTFGVTLDPNGKSRAAEIFGRGGNSAVRKIEDLPAKLSELYFRLARR